MPEFSIRTARGTHRGVLNRLMEFYIYDMGAFHPHGYRQHLDANGEFGHCGVDHFLEGRDAWAQLLLVDGHWAGFALSSRDVYLPGNDFLLDEFFVMRTYRRQGIGRWAARQLFDQRRGRWEVGHVPLNLPARQFWRSVIDDYTGGQFVEQAFDGPNWQGTLQVFDNRCPVGDQRPAVMAAGVVGAP